MSKAQRYIYDFFRKNPPGTQRTALASAYHNGYRTTLLGYPQERITYARNSEYWAAQRAGVDNAKDKLRNSTIGAERQYLRNKARGIK